MKRGPITSDTTDNSLPKTHTITELKELYNEVVSIPLPKSGKIINNTVVIKYSQENPLISKNINFERTFTRSSPNSSSPSPTTPAVTVGPPYIPSPFPQKVDNFVIQAFYNKDKRAIINSDPSNATTYFIEIWDSKGLIKTIPTTDAEGKHKQVFSDSTFSGFQWSPDGKYLAYIAERNPAKSSAYFDQDNKQKNVLPGSKYDLKESWGETYGDAYCPTLFIVNTLTGFIWEPSVGIPPHLSKGTPQWVKDGKGIVFVGWEGEDWKNNMGRSKLGMVYCTNKNSALYYLQDVFLEEENSTKLSEKKIDPLAKIVPDRIVKITSEKKVRCPRFSPDGKQLIYLSFLDDMETHQGPARLCALDWTTKVSRIIKDVVDYPAEPTAFPGLFTDTLPTSCFLGNHSVVLESYYYSDRAILAISLLTGAVDVIQQRGAKLLDIEDDVLLISSGLANLIPVIIIGKYNKEAIQWETVDASARCLPIANRIEALSLSVESVDVNIKAEDQAKEEGSSTVNRFEYILLAPEVPAEGEKTGLVVFPHGGPHSTFDTHYDSFRVFLALLGYHVILINYRGSLGFGLHFLNSLPGNIGNYDVQDCMDSITHVLSKYSSTIDPEKVFYYGGSHSGFIGGHLIAKDRRIKAAVLRNPVTNVAAMAFITDIPEWCLVEANEKSLSSTAIQRMYALSPIEYIDQIKTPTLLVIGEKDLRVPPSQGLSFFYALRERGVPTRALIYPGEGHAIEKPEHLVDISINSIRWFQEEHASPDPNQKKT